MEKNSIKINRQNSVRAGILDSLPLAIAVFAYGLSYGVMAAQAGFTLLQAVMMSALVFSGSIQLVAVSMIISGIQFMSILLVAFLLNLRNLLYGAALAEGLSQSGRWKWLLATAVSDESLVLGTSHFKKQGPDHIYFAALALTFFLPWILAAWLGFMLGGSINPQTYGLDLAFPVTFMVILVPALADRPGLATCLAGVLVALLMEYVFPKSGLTIIVGGLTAPLIGVYLSKKKLLIEKDPTIISATTLDKEEPIDE